VGRKPFEIVAECEMTGFPMAADIERIGARIEKARRARPDVVRAAVSSPAIYRDRLYVLDTRFLVWAEDGAGASRAVGELLKAAGVPCRTVVPSGRALAEAEVSPPAKAAKPASAPKRAKPRPAEPARKIARLARKGRKAPRRAPAAAPKRATKPPARRKRRPR
jgi:hypothetical protein